MSEEKKAIEMLRNYDNEDNLHKIHQSINVLLNLIEKQQKEIEESENYMKDKIREKIEDLEDYMILFTNDKEKFNRYKYARDILEKLLKEE